MLIDDLLCLTFRWGVTLATAQNLNHTPPHVSPAWLYASVSRRWRELSLTDSTLWTDIHVDPSRLPSDADALQWYVSTLLERSKVQPLNVGIHASSMLTCSKTLTMLINAQSRWASVSISSPTPSSILGIGTTDHVRAWCCLRSLTLDLAWEDKPGMILDLRPVTTLQHFCEMTTDIACEVYLPWDYLKSFHLIVRHETHHIASRFDFGRQLEKCEIDVGESPDRRPRSMVFPAEHAIFAHVKSLLLRNCTALLPLFRGSPLEDLRIDGDFYNNTHYLPELSQMLTKASGTLVELRLEGLGVTSWDAPLASSITSLPHLRSLTVITYILPHSLVPSIEGLPDDLSWPQQLLSSLEHFFPGARGRPCPELRTFRAQWVILNGHPHPKKRLIVDWKQISRTWYHTWATRDILERGFLSVEVGRERRSFYWPVEVQDLDSDST